MNSRSVAKWFFLASLFLPLSSWAQSPTSRESAGSISGRIVLAPDGRPAAHLSVELRGSSGRWVATATTDADGGFSFAGLPSDTYSVSVQAQEFAPLRETVQLGFAPTTVELRMVRIGGTRDNRSSFSSSVSVRELTIPEKAHKAYEKGLRRLSEDDAAGSMSLFERAIAEFPGYFEAYYQIGLAHMKLVHAQEAFQAFRKSVELSGGRYAEAQVALGLLLCYQGDFSAAEPVLREALKLNPASAKTHYSLGLALFGLNRLDEAERSAQGAILRKDDFAEPFLLLAEIHMRQDNPSAVVKDLNAYLELQPSGEHSAQARAIRENAQRAISQSKSALALSQSQP